MGLRHVLEYYLRGLRVGAESVRDLPDLDGDLREMQFESVWRLCEWDPALVAVGGIFCVLLDVFISCQLLAEHTRRRFRLQSGCFCFCRWEAFVFYHILFFHCM